MKRYPELCYCLGVYPTDIPGRCVGGRIMIVPAKLLKKNYDNNSHLNFVIFDDHFDVYWNNIYRYYIKKYGYNSETVNEKIMDYTIARMKRLELEWVL